MYVKICRATNKVLFGLPYDLIFISVLASSAYWYVGSTSWLHVSLRISSAILIANISRLTAAAYSAQIIKMEYYWIFTSTSSDVNVTS